MRIAVIGGGIGGLTAALALNKLNIENTVYESAPELRADGAGLALASNAIKAFSLLGINETVVNSSNRITEFCIYNHKEKPLIKRYSERILSDELFHSFTIHRQRLHTILSDNLQDDQIVTGKSVTDFRNEKSGVKLYFNDNSSELFDYVIASDGINSVFRRKLVPAAGLRYAGYYCWRGVTENYQCSDTTLAAEYWGAGLRFGIVPLPENRVYWFACMNNPDDDPAYFKITRNGLLSAFSDFPAQVSELINAVPENKILINKISDLTPLDYYSFKRILLLGDAAHATTPNLGQGACLAIEDAAVLYKLLQQNRDMKEIFENYSLIRVPRCKYIIKQSRQTGELAGIQNPAGIMLRDLLLKIMPQSVTERQTRKILKFGAA